MKGICTNCGRTFYSETPRQTCGTKCSLARQVEAIRQMKMKTGLIYERWKTRMAAGIKAGKERRSKQKGGDK